MGMKTGFFLGWKKHTPLICGDGAWSLVTKRSGKRTEDAQWGWALQRVQHLNSNKNPKSMCQPGFYWSCLQEGLLECFNISQTIFFSLASFSETVGPFWLKTKHNKTKAAWGRHPAWKISVQIVWQSSKYQKTSVWYHEVTGNLEKSKATSSTYRNCSCRQWKLL